MVTAPNAAAAARLCARRSVNPPEGDVATTAYAGTGWPFPPTAPEPGRKIDPADLQPGDIAVFGDHTALVAGTASSSDPTESCNLGSHQRQHQLPRILPPDRDCRHPCCCQFPATGVSALLDPVTGIRPATLLAAPVATANANTSSAKPSAAPTPSPPTSHVR